MNQNIIFYRGCLKGSNKIYTFTDTKSDGIKYCVELNQQIPVKRIDFVNEKGYEFFA